MKLINIWFLQRAAQLHRVLLLRYQAAMLQLRVLVLTQCPAGQLTLLSTSTILLLCQAVHSGWELQTWAFDIVVSIHGRG